MRNKFFAALAAVALLFAPSCDKGNNGGENTEPEVQITLVVRPQQVTIPADGGFEDILISVSTGAEWDFVNGSSWIEVELTEGGMTISAEANTSSELRKGEILIFATAGKSRVEKSLVVEQAASGGTTSDGELSFECPVFEQLMLDAFDTNADGALSVQEAAVVTELVLTLDEESTNEAITSLRGIKNFVNLTSLDCDGNLLTELDLSGMAKLEYVDCCYNKIKELNVSGCSSLKWLYCYMNDIESLYLEGCSQMMFLQAYKNKLTKLDVSNMAELVYFDVRLNSLREVKFDNCPKMQIAAIGNNNLISLSLTGLPNLETLGCYENSIASLDVSQLPKLNLLECYTNNLQSLNLSANTQLTALTCQNNLITELNIDACTALKKLDCSNNRLSGSMNFSKYPALYYLHCGGNNLQSIDVASCKQMTDLACENTSISTIDVTGLTLLESFVANNCLLKVVDCSNNIHLNKLYLQGNPLEQLILANGQTIADIKLDNHNVITYK